MKRWMSVAVLLLVSLNASAGSELGAIQRNKAYGPLSAQKLDVYLPSSKPNGRILLMIHGGAWAHGDKAAKAVVENKSAYWLSRGYVFVSANYRLLPTRIDEQAQDIGRALAYVQRNAVAWGANASEVTLMGHSAGAHLVSLLASDPQIAYAQGAKPWRSTVALDTAVINVFDVMRRQHLSLYDDAFGDNPAYWEKVSPLHKLSYQSTDILFVCSMKRPDQPCDAVDTYVTKATLMRKRAEMLPVHMTHQEINNLLGVDGGYTQAVDRFISQK